MGLAFKYIFLSIIFVLFSFFFLQITIKAQTISNYRFLEVIDTQEKPVSDATVEVFRLPSNLTFKTNEKGIVKDFPVGYWFTDYVGIRAIKISKPGYIPTLLLTSSYDKKQINTESTPIAYEDIGAFENHRKCHNCLNLLQLTRPNYKKEPIKIKLLLLPSTKTEWEAFELEQKNQELIPAIVKNDTLRVQELLQLCNANSNSSRHDIPAILWATANSNKEIIELLLEAGADVKSKNSLGQKVIIYYIYFAHLQNISRDIDVKLVEKLIKAGADINASTLYGTTALDLTLSKFFENTELKKLLKKYKAKYSMGARKQSYKRKDKSTTRPFKAELAVPEGQRMD